MPKSNRTGRQATCQVVHHGRRGGSGGVDGVAVFDALHRRRKATEAILYAFDLLELDGEDLRPLPLGARKA